LDLYTDTEARKQAEKDSKRAHKAYDQAVKNRENAIKERRKMVEQNRKKAQREAEKQAREAGKLRRQAEQTQKRSEEVAQKEARRRAGEEQRRLKEEESARRKEEVVLQEEAEALEKQRAKERVATEKPKKPRKFCTLPRKVDRVRDWAWVEVQMHGVDEVGAHCGLFFPGPHYEKLIGDVGSRIVAWVQEDASKRAMLACVERERPRQDFGGGAGESRDIGGRKGDEGIAQPRRPSRSSSRCQGTHPRNKLGID